MRVGLPRRTDKISERLPMARSMRVQILDPPAEVPRLDPFSEVGLGIGEQNMAVLRTLWKFRYMGNARFEDGSVFKALYMIQEQADQFEGIIINGEDQPIFVICHQAERNEVTERILTWATEECTEYPFEKEHRTSEDVLLWQALQDPPQTKACGWLELDNGFMFFTNGDMFACAALLLGVRTDGS